MKKDELLKRLETLKKEMGARACFGCRYINDKCLDEGCLVIREAIKAIKTPDEGGEKRGKWLDIYGNYSLAKCSVCGEVYDAIQPSEYNNPECWDIILREYRYCPKCGAKMDGKE